MCTNAYGTSESTIIFLSFFFFYLKKLNIVLHF